MNNKKKSTYSFNLLIAFTEYEYSGKNSEKFIVSNIQPNYSGFGTVCKELQSYKYLHVELVDRAALPRSDVLLPRLLI